MNKTDFNIHPYQGKLTTEFTPIQLVPSYWAGRKHRGKTQRRILFIIFKYPITLSVFCVLCGEFYLGGKDLRRHLLI